MNAKIRWGLLGTGAIARCLAENLPQSRTGVLSAVGSRTAESAQKFADKHNIPRVHGSYDALLADPEVDAVYISTPHPMHAEWTIKAVRAGKHVLCEKPFTLNHAEALAVIDAAAAAGVTVMEAFMWRCHPQTTEILRLIREKAIGDVKLINASFGFKSGFNADSRTWSNGLAGGGIMDVGCYAVSAARLFAGAATGQSFADPLQVAAVGHLAETGVDSIAVACLKFPGGIVAQAATALTMNPDNDLKIFGTDGWIHVPNPWVADRSKPIDGKILVHHAGTTRQIDVPAGISTYAMEVDAFAAAVQNGTGQAASPAMTWADTLGQARTLDQWRTAVGVIYKSETPEGFPPVTIGGAPLKASTTIPHAKINGLDKPVSRLVLGCDNQGSFPGQAHICDAFFEAGGNAFDTAFIYGSGTQERLLGQWMKHRGVRDQCVVITKGAHTPHCNPHALSEQLLTSLSRLQSDGTDIYMMHRDNPDIPVGEFIDVLNEHVQAGRIKIFGGSNWSIDRITAANDYAKKNGKQGFSVVSNNFSLARMIEAPWGGCVSASDDASRAWLEQTQTALLPWSSQAQGFFVVGRAAPDKLDDKNMARCWYSDENFERLRRATELGQKRAVPAVQIALAYVLAQPFPVFALIGPRTPAELRSSLPGLKVRLSEEEVRWLDLRN
ncbi:MAG TPA: aldo/keto reductase [Tepidisphaeraceae bacterium]|jgi:predicted dehydrogenase/aryl-alcohol dehydrogenase-like predicted oxidoreductase